MSDTATKMKLPVIGLMILLAALSRLLPHPPNFTPVAAMALFGAAYYARFIIALLVPLAALWISDLLLNNLLLSQYYDGFVLFGHGWVYAGFAMVVVLGWFTVKKWTPGKLIGATVIGSILFFLVTNFGHWASPFSLHPKTISGLAMSYVDAIPFFWNTLFGNLVYTAILFGGYEWYRKSSLAQVNA